MYTIRLSNWWYNNVMTKRVCIECKKILTVRHQKKYCSNRCQFDWQYRNYISKWKQGLKSGTIGINARDISGYLRRYLFEKYGEYCSICKWNKRHPKTKRVPLEIDHIDGNSENNTEKNLRLLCPNCHALTINFKNLNKGKGRSWRKEKYKKN